MTSYKLVYFNARGRAELTRFIFAQAGVEYVDERVKQEDWPARKPTTPFGSIPVLEVNGKQLAGSAVIARYVAEKYGVAGSNEFENAVIASIVDSVGDLMQKGYTFFFENNEAKKAELKKDMEEKHLPTALGYFEKFAAGNPSGWLVGSNLSYADFSVFLALETLQSVFTIGLDNFPSLAQLKKNVESLPRIAKWIQERPPTPF